MKKLFTLFLVCALTVCMMASCGGSDKLFDYNYDEYVTLGNYKGVEVSASAIETEVQAQIDSILSSNAKDVATGAPAADGNKVTYSVTATVNGAEAADLAKTDSSVTLGSGKTGLDDLDAALVGMSVGDTKEVTLTVPADYTGNADIDGKEAVLSVSVSAVTENVKPEELTDEMINTASDGLYTNVADYTVYLRSAVKQNMAWSAVLANTTYTDYPKKEAEMYYNNYLASYQNSAAQYGMTLESMASMYGMTMDAFLNNLAQQAVAQTNQIMAMYALAAKEGLTPDDTVLAEVKQEMIEYNGFADEKELLANVSEDDIYQSAISQMAIDFAAANAVEVE
jgi:trigger factor